MAITDQITGGTITRRDIGDTNATLNTTDTFVALTAALTAPRTWTLPAASSANGDIFIIVQDTVGGVDATNTLTIQAATGDTLNGDAAAVIDVPFDGLELCSDGVSAWSYARKGAGAGFLAGAIAYGDGTTQLTSSGDLYWDATNSSLWASKTTTSATSFPNVIISKARASYTGDDLGGRLLFRSSDQTGAAKNIAAFTSYVYDDSTVNNLNAVLLDVGVGANSLGTTPGYSYWFSVYDAGGGSHCELDTYSYEGSVTYGGGTVAYVSGGTRTSPSSVASGNELNYTSTFGYNGTAYYGFAITSVFADGSVTSSSTPGRIVFYTTTSGSTSVTEKARLDNAGNFLIGTTTAGSKLTVAGQINGAYNDTTSVANTLAQALGTNTVSKVKISADSTLTTTVPAAGARATVIILTSGTSSRTVTFGSGFKTTGTLATGTVDAKLFCVSFVSDGTNLIETGRTTAM